MKKTRVSLKRRVWIAVLLPVLTFTALLFLSIRMDLEILFAIPAILLLTVGLVASMVNFFYQPFASLIESIETGLNCFHDEDFSINIADYDFEEFQVSVNTYNQLSELLRSERMELHQRELLLDTIIQNTPMAIILTSSRNEIIYSNLEAKNLLKQTKRIEGNNFHNLANNLPPDLEKATLSKRPGLYTDTSKEEKRVVYLIVETFNLNSQIHYLYLYKNMTSEVHKEEIQVWKKVIRMISHELNNSLAPIQSLTRSAQKRLAQTSEDEMLEDIFETIERRAKHLQYFIEKYAKFSRLPNPEIRSVDISQFIGDIENICQIKVSSEIQSDYFRFDPVQIEQVLINLIKNARESGSSESDISLKVFQSKNQLNFVVTDRGAGMSEEQLSQSVLPFYTTKQGGTGLGLALCKEIVNAHAGQLRIYNRQTGGLAVEFSLEILSNN